MAEPPPPKLTAGIKPPPDVSLRLTSAEGVEDPIPVMKFFAGDSGTPPGSPRGISTSRSRARHSRSISLGSSEDLSSPSDPISPSSRLLGSPSKHRRSKFESPNSPISSDSSPKAKSRPRTHGLIYQLASIDPKFAAGVAAFAGCAIPIFLLLLNSMDTGTQPSAQPVVQPTPSPPAPVIGPTPAPQDLPSSPPPQVEPVPLTPAQGVAIPVPWETGVPSFYRKSASSLQTEQQNALQQNALEQNALEQNALQQNALQQNALQQNALQQNALQQNALQQNALQQSALQKNAPQQNALYQSSAQQNTLQQKQQQEEQRIEQYKQQQQFLLRQQQEFLLKQQQELHQQQQQQQQAQQEQNHNQELQQIPSEAPAGRPTLTTEGITNTLSNNNGSPTIIPVELKTKLTTFDDVAALLLKDETQPEGGKAGSQSQPHIESAQGQVTGPKIDPAPAGSARQAPTDSQVAAVTQAPPDSNSLAGLPGNQSPGFPGLMNDAQGNSGTMLHVSSRVVITNSEMQPSNGAQIQGLQNQLPAQAVHQSGAPQDAVNVLPGTPLAQGQAQLPLQNQTVSQSQAPPLPQPVVQVQPQLQPQVQPVVNPAAQGEPQVQATIPAQGNSNVQTTKSNAATVTSTDSKESPRPFDIRDCEFNPDMPACPPPPDRNVLRWYTKECLESPMEPQCLAPDYLFFADGDLDQRLNQVCQSYAVSEALREFKVKGEARAVWHKDPSAAWSWGYRDIFLRFASVENSGANFVTMRRLLDPFKRNATVPACSKVERSEPLSMELYVSPFNVNFVSFKPKWGCSIQAKYKECFQKIQPSPPIVSLVEGEPEMARLVKSVAVYSYLPENQGPEALCSGCPAAAPLKGNSRNSSSEVTHQQVHEQEEVTRRGRTIGLELCIMRKAVMTILGNPSVDFSVGGRLPTGIPTLRLALDSTRHPLVLSVTKKRMVRCGRGVVGVDERESIKEHGMNATSAGCLMLHAAELFSLARSSALIATSFTSAGASLIAEHGAWRSYQRVIDLIEHEQKLIDKNTTESLQLAEKVGQAARGAGSKFVIHDSVCRSPAIAPLPQQPFAWSAVVAEKLNLLFCTVPLSQHAPWLHWLRGKFGLAQPSQHKHHSAMIEGLPLLATNFTELQAAKALTKSTLVKVAVLRNPFFRISSAYTRMFPSADSLVASPVWLQHYFGHLVSKEELDKAVTKRGYIPFRGFVELVHMGWSRNKHRMNNNLSPQSDLCGLQSIKYDFIASRGSRTIDVRVLRAKLKERDLGEVEKVRDSPEDQGELVKLYTRQAFEQVKEMYRDDLLSPINGHLHQTPKALKDLFEAEHS